jgi:hypothetical protein
MTRFEIDTGARLQHFERATVSAGKIILVVGTHYICVADQGD